jgi:phage FluMu gp28-like protein
MPRYKAAFEDADITVPKDEGVLSDHRAVQLVNGVPRVPDSGHTSDLKDGGKRHGDAAIAGCLAWFATSTQRHPLNMRAMVLAVGIPMWKGF